MRDDRRHYRDSSSSPTNSSGSARQQNEAKSSESGDSSESRTADVLNMLGKGRDDDKHVPKRTSAALKCWDITESELRKYFHMPLSRVAKELSCSRTSLKKICRKNGIQRWPCRPSGRLAMSINAKLHPPGTSDESRGEECDECDDERDDDRSKAELSNSGSSGRDGRQTYMGDRDSYYAPLRPTKTTHALGPQERTGYWHSGPTSYPSDQSEGARRHMASQPSIEQVAAFAPGIVMYGNAAIHERSSSEHADYMNTQQWHGLRHPSNGTASYINLPPIHGTLMQHGAGHIGGGNDLRAAFSTTFSGTDTRLQMEGTPQDDMRRRMTAAMKLGETRALLKEVASLLPADARLMNAMEAVDVLISSMGVATPPRHGDYLR